MAGDRIDDVLGIVAPAQLLERVARMPGVEVGIALVVEVVDQAGDRPALLVLAEAPGVGAHGGLDAQQVLAERVRFDPLADEIPGLFTRRLSRHVCFTLARNL